MDVSGADAFDASVPLSSLVGMQQAPGMLVNHHPGMMTQGGMMMASLAPEHLSAPTHMGLPVVAAAGMGMAAVDPTTGLAPAQGGMDVTKGKKRKGAKGSEGSAAAAGPDAGKKPRKRAKADVSVPPKATLSVQEPLAKKRRRKDKEAPKKPRSAYIVFLDRHREEIRKACPEMQMKNITAALAKQWKLVTEEELARCKAIAQEERGVYEARKKAYEEEKALRPPPPVVPEAKPKVRRAKKDKEAPKKGRSAFILFLMEYRGNNKQQNNSVEAFADVSKSVGTAWAKLTAEQRAPFLERARQEAAQYEGAKKAYLEVKQARLEAGELLAPLAKPHKKERKAKKAPLDLNLADVPFVQGVLDPAAQHQAQAPPPALHSHAADATLAMSTADLVMGDGLGALTA